MVRCFENRFNELEVINQSQTLQLQSTALISSRLVAFDLQTTGLTCSWNTRKVVTRYR